MKVFDWRQRSTVNPWDRHLVSRCAKSEQRDRVINGMEMAVFARLNRVYVVTLVGLRRLTRESNQSKLMSTPERGQEQEDG